MRLNAGTCDAYGQTKGMLPRGIKYVQPNSPMLAILVEESWKLLIGD
jgi:hypothetical protein